MEYLGKDEFYSIDTNLKLESIASELFNLKLKLPNELMDSFCASIIEYPQNGKDSIEIIRLLEESIYQGKQEGKNKIVFAHDAKMKLKSNYYSLTQLERLNDLSKMIGRTESSLLREALDNLFRKYYD